METSTVAVTTGFYDTSDDLARNTSLQSSPSMAYVRLRRAEGWEGGGWVEECNTGLLNSIYSLEASELGYGSGGPHVRGAVDLMCVNVSLLLFLAVSSVGRGKVTWSIKCKYLLWLGCSLWEGCQSCVTPAQRETQNVFITVILLLFLRHLWHLLCFWIKYLTLTSFEHILIWIVFLYFVFYRIVYML